MSGTIRIGFPLLAEANFSGGVRDYGNMSSAFGTGLLIGIVALKKLRAPAAATSGILVISLFSVVPIGLIVLALVPPIGVVLGAIFAMGGAFGYVTIFLLSWLQRRTPDHLLGRIMAV
ncbi:MAG: hypothetical protein GWN58_34840, partial [Anaerolineae bacterium]|nr:hypothetical protein [Anaerolineae bacterium]